MATVDQPLQNRVTPFGEIVRARERGMFFGNRGGCFHVEGGELTNRRWVNTHWITCVLSYTSKTPPYRVHKHPLRQAGVYTGLFFMDEATAFAAGHRPCFFCRRPEGKAFQAAWLAANPGVAADEHAIGGIDAVLHAERVGRRQTKLTYEARLGELPNGAFVTGGEDAWLVWHGELLRWTPGGYTERTPIVAGERATVLTPRSVVRMFAAGLVPGVHGTAAGG